MSSSTNLLIFCLAPSEFPDSTPEYVECLNACDRNPPRFLLSSHGFLYYKLHQFAENFGLHALTLFSPQTEVKEVPESGGGSFGVKRPGAIALNGAIKDIDALIARAASDPESLIIGDNYILRDAKRTEDEKRYIAECATFVSSEGGLKTEHLSVDEEEFWDGFFWFLRIFREICKENRESGKSMLFIYIR